jgi:hypothetical protein
MVVAVVVEKEQLLDLLEVVDQVVVVKVLKDQILETQEQDALTLVVEVVEVQKDLHQTLVQQVAQES